MSFKICTMPPGSYGNISHNTIYQMSYITIEDYTSKPCYYKSILNVAHAKAGHSVAFHTVVLHNWLYRKWFRPFRSDIDNSEFVAKFFVLMHLPEAGPPAPLAQSINRLNTETCN
jgi:hypothetical protein